MRTLAMLVVFLGLALVASAQNANQLVAKPTNDASVVNTPTATAVPEPGTPGQVNLLLGNGNLVALEARPLKYVPKMKGFGTVVVPTYEGSSVLVSPSTRFVVRLGDKPPYDSPSAVVLGVFPIGKGGVPAEKGVEVGFAPYGVNSAEIIPATPLSVGKYVVKTGAGFLVEVSPAK